MGAALAGMHGREAGEGSLPRHLIVLIATCLVAASCETATLTPAPTGPAASGATSTDAPGASTGPAGSDGVQATGGPGEPGEVPAALPLPLPSLTEPFGIGEALYDPGRMGDAVVSLLDLMGVGIYARDGTVIRKGDEHAAGDPWLTEDEVWGLIGMGTDDLIEAGDAGPQHTLAELHEALAPMLPQTSFDEFVAAYTEAYAQHPDHLVPQVMLGQPIDRETRLSRTQLWLLFMDGFVDLAQPASAGLRAGDQIARVGPRPPSGTANPNLPPLVEPSGLQPAAWAELQAHVLTLSQTVRFTVGVASVHEGHGGQGAPANVIAAIGGGASFVSPTTGQTILQGRQAFAGQVQVAWSSTDASVLDAHGTTSVGLPSTTTMSNGLARLGYTPKREAGNGTGFVAKDWANVSATVNSADLLSGAYVVDATLADLIGNTLVTARTESGAVEIAWHAPGLDLEITNTYDVTIGAEPGGMVARAHRKGADTFKGVLTLRADGTYRGTLDATSKATSEMEFVVPLAGDRCEDSTDSVQRVAIVGSPRSSAPIDAALDVLASGQFGTSDLLLRFYPASPPAGGLGRCQGTIGYLGPGPTGSRMSGTYLSYNDARITIPSSGYLIHLPPRDGALKYEDWRQILPQLGVDSVFDITVRAEGAP